MIRFCKNPTDTNFEKLSPELQSGLLEAGEILPSYSNLHESMTLQGKKVLNFLNRVRPGAGSCSGLQGKTIVSWNINSLRARIVDDIMGRCPKNRKIMSTSPMGELIASTKPDIICLQETKLQSKFESCFNVEG